VYFPSPSPWKNAQRADVTFKYFETGGSLRKEYTYTVVELDRLDNSGRLA
jgi:hypothetical protein